MDPFMSGNQQLWDEWTEINFHSSSYNVAGFIANPDPLSPLIIDGIGDVAGKSLLHLQCHFGKDTLRLARMGAKVTGVDFSAKAIRYARQLAETMNLPATFIESNVYSIPQVIDEKFDVVFTSYGVLNWLPDLDDWGKIIGQLLKPGGAFYIIECHPTLMMFDEYVTDGLQVAYSYFHLDEPLIFPPHIGTYADPTAEVTETEYSWQHSLSDIITPLLAAGLRLDFFREYPHVTWQALPIMVLEDNYWRLPPEYPQMPLSFAIRATKE